MRKIHTIKGVKWFRSFACGEKFSFASLAFFRKNVTCKKCLKKMGK